MKIIKKSKIRKHNGKLTVKISIVTFEETDFRAKRLDVNNVRSYLESKGHKVANGTGPLLTNYNNKTEGTFIFDLLEEKKKEAKAPKASQNVIKSSDYLEAAYTQPDKKASKKSK